MRLAVLAQLVAGLCGAGTSIVYAGQLSAAQIGVLALAFALATGAVLLGDMGTQLWSTRAVAAGQFPADEAAGMLLQVVGTASLAVGAAVYGLIRLFGLDRLAVVSEQVGFVAFMALTASLVLFQVAITVTQAGQRNARRAVVVVVNGVGTLVLTAAALSIRTDARTAVLATSCAYVCAAITGLAGGAVRAVRRPLPRGRYIEAIKGGAPLGASALLTFIASTGDVLLARYAMNLNDLGVYQLLKRTAAAAAGPLLALLPLLFVKFTLAPQEQRRRLLQRAQVGLATAFAGGFLVVTPATEPVLSRVFGEMYARGDIAALVVAGISIQVVHNLAGYFLTAHERFAAPLAINGVAVGVLCAGTALLSGDAGAIAFLLVLASAHASAVVVAAVKTARVPAGPSIGWSLAPLVAVASLTSGSLLVLSLIG